MLLTNLINGQENFKRYSLVRLQLMCKLLDIRLSWVLAQSAKTLANLMLLDLSITTIVEEVEGFLELCRKKIKTQFETK